jgi:hypothetical protein
MGEEMNIDEKLHQVETYGKVLEGTETELEIAKLARKSYLKQKMRKPLAWVIGDYGDNITDVTRTLVLGEAIRLGLVTDQAVIDGYKGYVETLLIAYGGEKAIMQVLGSNLEQLNIYLISGYYVAKAAIETVESEEEVNLVDIE